MKISIKKKVSIKSVEDWGYNAPPKDADVQWKDGRSAKELARFVTSDRFAPFMSGVLKDWKIKEQDLIAEPEAETYFPAKELGKNGPRNHDLLLIGKDCVIGIEAKVSESFDQTIKVVWDKSDKGENRKKRILGLINFLSGEEYSNVDDLPADIQDLRYQLFTATVGTVVEAIKNKKKKAVVLVLVFEGDVQKETDYDKHIENNNNDYNDFVSKFFNQGWRMIQGIECRIDKRVIRVANSYPNV